MTKPTDEQVKELWEWCGFRIEQEESAVTWYDSTGEIIFGYPSIDLNNLSEYAVPTLLAGDKYSIKIYTHKANNEVTVLAHYAEDKGSYAGNPDLALALFWAIWEVIHD